MIIKKERGSLSFTYFTYTYVISENCIIYSSLTKYFSQVDMRYFGGGKLQSVIKLVMAKTAKSRPWEMLSVLTLFCV